MSVGKVAKPSKRTVRPAKIRYWLGNPNKPTATVAKIPMLIKTKNWLFKLPLPLNKENNILLWWFGVPKYKAKLIQNIKTVIAKNIFAISNTTP